MTDNVIAFPKLQISLPPEIVEVVEIIRVFGLGYDEYWIAGAGPWKNPPDMVRGGRHPWQRQAIFPVHEAAAAAFYAREMSTVLNVPIIDLAGVMDKIPPAAHANDGPEAA